jgi:hypothetical protein
LNEDFSLIATFIRKNCNPKLKQAIINCRDIAISSNQNFEILLKAIKYALSLFSDSCLNMNVIHHNVIGQRKRYQDISKAIKEERIRRCDNKYLRNLDVSILDSRDSKLVRRIVEKRMSQEYHKQHKEEFHITGNKSRHQMKRAVSFQLYNIGQIETVSHRDRSTHWKWKYDNELKQWVLKQKISYNTEEEALLAAEQYSISHPNENNPLGIYQCTHCKKYHIGHSRSISEAVMMA